MWNVWWGVADMTEVWGWYWAKHSTPDLYCFARSSALPSHEWTFQPAWAQQPSSNIRTGLLQCSSVDLPVLKFVCTCTFVSYLSITFCSSFVFSFTLFFILSVTFSVPIVVVVWLLSLELQMVNQLPPHPLIVTWSYDHPHSKAPSKQNSAWVQ